MRTFHALLLTLLFLVQNVQVVQSTNLFETADGEETPLGAIICYIFPCFDESLGWRNIFAPIAADPTEESQANLPEIVPYSIPAEDEATVRQQFQTLAMGFLQFLNSRQDDGGLRRNLRAVTNVESDLN